MIGREATIAMDTRGQKAISPPSNADKSQMIMNRRLQLPGKAIQVQRRRQEAVQPRHMGRIHNRSLSPPMLADMGRPGEEFFPSVSTQSVPTMSKDWDHMSRRGLTRG